MIPQKHAIIVEGKFDYHPMQYFAGKFSKKKLPIFPVNGAGDAAPLLSLFRGWGVKYLILLDDDKPGQRERDRYIKELGVAPEDICTLADVDTKLAGKAFEGAYGPEVKAETQKRFGVSTPSKRDFCDLFTRLHIEQDFKVKLGETDKIGKKLTAYLEAFLDR
jgi:hypothetical protein